MELFITHASIYLAAAVLLVPLSVRLGLGSVLGFLSAGIVIGPILGLVGAETGEIQHFAEFGVVMLLFVIGLELEPRALWDMRKRLIGLGGLQVALTSLAIGGLAMIVGLSWPAALTVGLTLSLSSTAIVLQTLTEKNLLRSPGGRSVFAVLLSQDLAVVPILALVPLLAGIGGLVPAAPETAEASMPEIATLIDSLPGWAATLVTLTVVVAIVLGGHFLSRPVFRFVHASRLPEMSTFISLLIVLGIALAMMAVGLSPALGTFLAGVVLASSEFRHQIEVDIQPFKGLLMGIFFMTVGAQIDLGMLADNLVLVLCLTLAVIAVKVAVLFGLGLVFGLRRADIWLFALGLAQAGEFAFLLTGFANQQRLLADPQSQILLLVIAMTMVLTPLLFVLQEWISARAARDAAERDPDRIEERGRVIIAGIGRFGQVVNRLVRTSGLETVVLDADISTIELMRRFGVKGYFGDPSRHELLEAAGLATAEVLVVAVDKREAATQIVSHARKVRPDLHIVARARDRVHVYELFQAGANDIVRETFDSSVRAGRYVLENMGFTEYEAAKLSQTYYKVDRAAMRDLAQLWVPGQPVHLNEAYVARAKQLDRDLETALIEELDQNRRNPDAAE
ncbi:monovalent cation:proton antiporter-2 (CPA2) family protein [Tabrizicola sp. J26]|uniref:monovalent cation:proton antiporter-2 (CPA2) family protein n=1 Tax=Alitabrizicola rongguiensis TaxID=2909234 RepID=UPI001F29C2DF|nr:monovalent cation:proton antiporter-2 (CPA2) family protein [Tabrizicola rongguiensis]MCF1708992.1 monovalent cation:proton antiporter-2 (CPA2) family protein [Tabrizicola rongguiensis]